MATRTGYVNGSDLLLYIDNKAIGHCTSHTLTFATETKERVVKAEASAASGAGLWKNKDVTSLSVSISGEGLRYYGETESGFAELLALYKNGTHVTVKGCLRGSESSYFEGDFVITNLQETSPAQDDATYSISLENSGAVDISPNILNAPQE